MKPSVAIITINWNGLADTLECLASLREDRYERKQVIVVDNGSSDDSVAVIRQRHPEVEVIATGANLGFTGGNNVGIRHALGRGFDYVYLLNNDTTSDPDALSELVRAAEADRRWGLLTPVIHYYDAPDEVWFGGATLDLARGLAVHDNSRPPNRGDAVREVPWASGCAMLMPAAVARDLGGFDDRFFLIWEDVDLSLRCRAKGWRIGLVPEARIRHKVSRSIQSISTKSLYYYVRNHLMLLSRHGGRGAGGKVHAVTARLREVCGRARDGDPKWAGMLAAILHGVCDYCRGRCGAMPGLVN